MLEHGFICIGTNEPNGTASPVLETGSDGGSVSIQIVPPGWNAVPDSYGFVYIHPLRGNDETFTVKSLAIGSSLAVHAASSSAGADLLTLTVPVDKVQEGVMENDHASVITRAREWQEKATVGIAMRLLARQNSTARFGKALEAQSDDAEKANKASGTKRRAPEESPPHQPGNENERDIFRPTFPGGPFRGDPFSPGFPGVRPVIWTPDGDLLGPRHPAWGQVVPGRGGGMMPRFDPILPGGGEPDPDHLPVPGLYPSGGRRMDPDGIFMM